MDFHFSVCQCRRGSQARSPEPPPPLLRETMTGLPKHPQLSPSNVPRQIPCRSWKNRFIIFTVNNKSLSPNFVQSMGGIKPNHSLILARLSVSRSDVGRLGGCVPQPEPYGWGLVQQGLPESPTLRLRSTVHCCLGVVWMDVPLRRSGLRASAVAS